MPDIEKGQSFSNEFQRTPKYEKPERSPFIVTGQTYGLLKLYHANALPNFSQGRDYLQDYTFPYLTTAEKTSDTVFDKTGAFKGNADLESREVASHAYIIFAWLPDMTRIPTVSALKDGFSRRGMLRAPLTQREYKLRIRELKVELAKIATGITKPKQILRPKPSLLRTFVFFRVAAFLNPSFKLNAGEKELVEKQQEERQNINNLLKGVSTLDEI